MGFGNSEDRTDSLSGDDAVLDEAAQWLTRASEGMDDRTRGEFLAWLRADPAHAAATDMVSRAWEAAPAAAYQGGFSVSPMAAPSEIRTFGTWTERKRGLFAGFGLAGGALAALAMVLLLSPATTKEYAASGSKRREVALADGSHVWLAPGSRMTAKIGLARREVRLIEGEAAFDVVHGWRPFTVSTAAVTVIDLGTLFDVRARSGAPTEVSLAHGAIAVTDEASGRPLAAPRPGQKLTITREGARIEDADVDSVLAWREGRLVFSDRRLDDALAAFREQGAPPIRLADPALASLPVSGAYSTQDVESFLSGLAAIYPVHWARHGESYELDSGRR